jgi:hypothetical protein
VLMRSDSVHMMICVLLVFCVFRVLSVKNNFFIKILSYKF